MPAPLFPPIEPHAAGMLAVGDGHEIHWEECGNPAGPAILFLHGGPGSGCTPEQRRFFDPAHWRILLFDQRGAGRSRPSGEIAHNSTAHLIADIEALRQARGISRWVVFGGSWGSTLALAYAEAHPARVRGLILRGIWLCRERDLHWWLYGLARFFPEQWRIFAGHIPASERHDLLTAYLARLTDPDPAMHMPAAMVWKTYEQRCSTLLPRPATETDRAAGPETLAMARIEAHYMAHRCFLGRDQLIEEIDRLRHIPAVLVHGRYDMICPMDGAEALARAWPEAPLTIVPDAGHSATEPGIGAALMAATEAFKRLPAD